MVKINVYYTDNGVGVSVDAFLIHQFLSKYYDCLLINQPNQHITPKSDIGIFIQSWDIKNLCYNKINILIPNEEWLISFKKQQLKNFDFVCCKSNYAHNLLKKYCNAITLYFWSRDLFEKHKISSNSIIHLKGKSIQKNTEILHDIKNLNILSGGNLSLQDLQEQMNKSSMHLCPSLYEGHGHYFYEALSCDKHVICSSIPVWKETIDPDYVDFLDIIEQCRYKEEYEFLKESFAKHFLCRRGFFVDKDQLIEKIKYPKKIKPPRNYILDLFETNKRKFLAFIKSL